MSAAETCSACKGRGYHNVRGSGPGAFRGGWKRRPCACTMPKAKAAKPTRVRPQAGEDVWGPLWLAYQEGARIMFPRRRITGYPDGLLAVRKAVLEDARAALAAMPENAMRAEALAVVDKLEARG